MLKLIADIFLFLICGVAPLVALVWIFASGNKKEKAKKAALAAQAAVEEKK